MEPGSLPSTREELAVWLLEHADEFDNCGVLSYYILLSSRQANSYVHLPSVRKHVQDWLEQAVSKWPELFWYRNSVYGDDGIEIFIGSYYIMHLNCLSNESLRAAVIKQAALR